MSGSTDYQQLRDLLLSPEVSALHSMGAEVAALKSLLHDPQQFARLLQPVLLDILNNSNPAVGLALAKALTPVIDEVLREKARQDTPGMSDALAPASTAAIALHYASAPEMAAQDIAPLVGGAIKEQIRGERDAVIDILYPIIGSTISKYLSQTLSDLVQSVNRKIESNFTFKGLSRKIRAHVTGVSEAELLLRESLAVRIQAAFLIHKASGLVIAQAQSPDSPSLDPDLLSGMLTAIRSLFNDSMDSAQTARELDQIEYGEWKIVLESAGYCYLAAVVQGIPDATLRTSMRQVLTNIVQQPGNAVEAYAGDATLIPQSIPQSVSNLVRESKTQQPAQTRRTPYAFIVAGLVILLLVGIPLTLHWIGNSRDRDVEARALSILRENARSPIRGIAVEADGEVIRLSGTTPNDYQRTRAEAVIKEAFPGHQIENRVSPAAPPPLPVFVDSRIEEIVKTLNTIDGVFLSARLQKGHLTLTGFLPDSTLEQPVLRSFVDIPGIQALEGKLAVGTPELAVRIYFETNSAYIRPEQLSLLSDIKELLRRAPWVRIGISGHSDSKGSETLNRALALRRAQSVEHALTDMGFESARFTTEGIESPPPGFTATDPDSLGRCVRFTLLTTSPPPSR
jgi:flagellar motor protein MotB